MKAKNGSKNGPPGLSETMDGTFYIYAFNRSLSILIAYIQYIHIHIIKKEEVDSR
jgi:hypothetical protein